MKALTLWQPWASLIVWGLKRYETRGWATGYRGPLAIHAGQQRVALAGLPEVYRQALRSVGCDDFSQPTGCVLGIVDLVRIETAPTRYLSAADEAQERAFGDHSPGRKLWRLARPRRFIRPRGCKGAQGLWDYDPPANWRELVVPVQRFLVCDASHAGC